MQLFYTQNINDQIAILHEEEARHVKVLRKNINDNLHLIDGNGFLYEGKIISFSDSKKHNEVKLEILSKSLQTKSRTYYFHLYIAPTKQNERMEWMLEKAIEVGLDEITFIETDHSEKSRINVGRLQKIAISAMKQSGEYYLPKLNELISFKEILDSGNDELKLLAHCSNGYDKHSIKSTLSPNQLKDKINIFIGPEGDFSDHEIKSATNKGYKGISLGNTRLRTETAGLYAAISLSNLGSM